MKTRSIRKYSQFLCLLWRVNDNNPELTLTNGVKWPNMISRLPALNRLYDNTDSLKDEALDVFGDDVVDEKMLTPFVSQIEILLPEDKRDSVISTLKRGSHA